MVFLVVAAALLTMQAYMKRGIQAAVKAQADLLGPQQVVSGSGRKTATLSSGGPQSTSRTQTKSVSRGGAQSMTKSYTGSQAVDSVSVTTLDYRP